MLFNSLAFLIFFPTVTVVYYFLSHRWRWVWLLAMSCIFYMYFIPAYILILVGIILIDFWCGLLIQRSKKQERKKQFLVASLVANVLLLFFFKYVNFANENIGQLAQFLNWNYSPKLLSIILPIGLSFHTFQSMSYVIEVYGGRQLAEKNLGIYALFVMFYPQLVAGPIERPQHMLPQLRRRQPFRAENISSGLQLMAWGFFKKLVVADRLALFVNHVYNNPTHFQGISLVIATICLAIQIYCDFSGYIDIARGAARTMGINLTINFRQPYFAQSVQDFWSRWNISLSTWFRDYVYIPLGGNRNGTFRQFGNILVVFALSGLWHGANWTFVVWGALHGAYLIGEHLLKLTKTKGLPKMLRAPITFALVCFAWIFFRANSWSDAQYIVSHLFVGYQTFFSHLTDSVFLQNVIGLGQTRSELIVAVLMTLILFTVELLNQHGELIRLIKRLPTFVRWSLYNLLIVLILVFGVFGEQQFIYFKF